MTRFAFVLVAATAMVVGLDWHRGFWMPGPKTRQQAPLHVGDIPLARASWGSLPIVTSAPYSCQIPPNGEFALTQVVGQLSGLIVEILVNGAHVAGGAGSAGVYTFNPPVLFRAGDVVTFTVLGGSGGQNITVYFGGWSLYPGEI